MLGLYAFKDCVTGEFDKFFVARNEQDAIRTARVSLGNHPFFRDMDLYSLACINQSNGDVNFDGIVFVCHCIDILQGGDMNVSEK